MMFEVREATLADRSAVSELLSRIGWPTRSDAGWKWLFQDNPSRRSHAADAPIGWVIESNGELHGYLANIHVDYLMSGEKIRGVTCSN